MPKVDLVLVEARAATDAELAALVTAQQRELLEVGAGPDAPGSVVRPAATYVVGVVNGRAVACGAVRILSGAAAEITGVYVRPAYRGRGLGRQLLAALEEIAFRAGHPMLRLETGGQLTCAIGLYVAAGYQRVRGDGASQTNGTGSRREGDEWPVTFEKLLPVPV